LSVTKVGDDEMIGHLSNGGESPVDFIVNTQMSRSHPASPSLWAGGKASIESGGDRNEAEAEQEQETCGH